MIRSIRIQNFKSVADVELSGLEQINVLYGPGDAGKTNILEAIGFLQAVVRQIDAFSLVHSGVRNSRSDLYLTSLAKHHQGVIMLGTTVLGPEEQQEIEYTVSLEPMEGALYNWLIVQEQLRIGDVTMLVRDKKEIRFLVGDEEERSSFVQPNQGAIIYLPSGYWVLESLRGFVSYQLRPDVLRTGIGNSSVSPIGLSGEKFSLALAYLFEKYPKIGREVVDRMRDLYEWIKDIQIDATLATMGWGGTSAGYTVEFVDKRMEKNARFVPSLLVSESAIYCLGLLVLAVHPGMPVFFAIDNFGIFADQSRISKLTQIFCDLFLRYSPNRQVILATSNQEVLEGLPENRAKIFLVNRRKDGTTVVAQK